MTEKRLTEIEQRAAKATPGPWRTAVSLEEADDWWGEVPSNVPETVVLAPAPNAGYAVCCTNDDGLATESEVEDAAFIAHSRTDIPELTAFVRELVEALELTLLFHSGSPWDDEKSQKWRRLQEFVLSIPGNGGLRADINDATTKRLCDILRDTIRRYRGEAEG